MAKSAAPIRRLENNANIANINIAIIYRLSLSTLGWTADHDDHDDD